VLPDTPKYLNKLKVKKYPKYPTVYKSPFCPLQKQKPNSKI
jgi:hypothetical protein